MHHKPIVLQYTTRAGLPFNASLIGIFYYLYR
uniref:Uncharacterized protein n=1 Tax=Podoviridae sp. ctdDI2 TaxID=2826567 RepID=A0A8S5NPM8_9CAUD|nr:MAG TPA: hypothetical protein [Podoviridae sp. ctdDI2]